MLPLFLDVPLLGACFVAGAWASGIYHAHRAYRYRLMNLPVRIAQWAVAG
jgi:hypothetical protein